MSTRDLMMAAAGSSTSSGLYVDDVFSTYVRTGTGAAASINNGIDLSTNGGLVISKGRSAATDWAWYDTVRGATKDLASNGTAAQTTQAAGLTTFNSNGYSIGSLAKINTSGSTYVDYTFRKQAKFFDVVTYTGDGTTNLTVPHSLGAVPGMIIIKKINNISNWSTIVNLNTSYYSTTGPGQGGVAGSPATPNINNGGDATGFGCGGGGAGYYGGNGGNGFIGGGGGGAAGYSGSQFGGAGGSGSVLINYNSTTVIFTSGTSWTVPSGVTSIKVWAIGAGGGGAGCGSTDTSAGGGGGAGGIAVKTWTVSPGNTITFTVGSAGSGGSNANNGNAGGSTSVTFGGLTITGNGGGAGQYNSGTAALGGTAVNGNTNIQGGNGGAAAGDLGGAGGGAIGGTAGASGATNGTGASGAQSLNISGLFAAVSLVMTNLSELYLNLSSGAVPASSVLSSGISTITVSSNSNTLNHSYVAYLFAHDTSSDGIIQCGSYTGNGSTSGPVVTLGWEPQYVMIKGTSSARDWYVVDTVRGMTIDATDAVLSPNLIGTEAQPTILSPTSTGFQLNTVGSPNQNNEVFVYMAIRRPNKPPTSGTQVFSPISYNGNSGTNSIGPTTTVAPDLFWTKWRAGTPGNSSHNIWDRLRGVNYRLFSNSPYGEENAPINSFDMNGVSLNGSYGNTSGTSYMGLFFRRAMGVFDIVCYTGTGTGRAIAHNLGVAPELMIIKGRNDATGNMFWSVFNTTIGNDYLLKLNDTSARTAVGFEWWTQDGVTRKSPDASNFYINTAIQINQTSEKFVAYLFATLAGVSKVGSYTGNGTSQTINCGFSTGARFVMIKRTNSTGDWYVWDTARGIVAANDPHLSLNTTVAEVTTDDSVDPAASGFIVNQVAATNINVNAATYIYLAIA
jgi:hypothetical protein